MDGIRNESSTCTPGYKMAVTRKIFVDLIVGARPNFMKAAPVHSEFLKYNEKYRIRLVHTGQHYDNNMSDIFFKELQMPVPDIHLGVGSGTHGVQTAKVMIRYEELLVKQPADLVLVIGDVNSTLACAITAVKLKIPVGHIEAGLRSNDRAMPEEINRILTDQISDLLFTPSVDADKNLLREGIEDERIFFTGNVMIDTLLSHLPSAGKSSIVKDLNLQSGDFAVLTLHRPTNVVDKKNLSLMLQGIEKIAERIPIVFPVHPRTAKSIEGERAFKHIKFMNPLGYIDFIRLQQDARFVMTDSGGIQEETTVLGVPCLTLRDSTERPITVVEGTNIVVGANPRNFVNSAMKILNGERKYGSIPKKWDGKAAERIVNSIDSVF